MREWVSGGSEFGSGESFNAEKQSGREAEISFGCLRGDRKSIWATLKPLLLCVKTTLPWASMGSPWKSSMRWWLGCFAGALDNH